MRQYTAAKAEHPDALLFFRLGDFYELFLEDARTAARALGITLTSRSKEKDIPMCGVPAHAADAHIAKLLRAGHRIAVCEQMEDPAKAKKIVRREVTRVLTPGTVAAADLGSGENNYLAAVHSTEAATGLALLDLSTGEFRAREWPGLDGPAHCADALASSGASELLLPTENPLLARSEPFTAALDGVRTKTTLDNWVFSAGYALPLLARQLGASSLDGFGVAGHTAAAIAAGAVLHYAQTTQKNALAHVDTLRFEERAAHLHLDQVSVRNLELLDPLFRSSGPEATLANTLDCCQTPMGKRHLRAGILRPLADPSAIQSRYEAVRELKTRLIDREELRRALGGVFDLERLLSRVALENAGPRDLQSLACSLRALLAVCRALDRLDSAAWAALSKAMDTLDALEARIAATLVHEPPATLAEGGAIAPGVHPELDELRATGSHAKTAIAAIENRERERTGIGSLKIRFNSVFGYYLEITRANLKHVPADYERKQTLVNAERYTTPELKDLEHRILTAEERSLEIERALFAELRQAVLAHAPRIRATSATLSEIDLLANFAHLAAERDWCEPAIDSGESYVLEAKAARHPVLEALLSKAGQTRFIPNDLYLDTARTSILLITGPNMGGKSTYLRQAALLVILAQMGSFVPARQMRYSLADRVYTRIGASDNLGQGRSTFMVEMTETAAILNTATARSLVLLDEMGRGTATFDGLALAWAALEHLHNAVNARTLFATHYHELTLLAGQLPRLANARASVQEAPQGIVFLHTIEPGAASKSYGIDVARLAGVPGRVLKRAREVLRAHERAEKRELAAETDAPLQLTLFTPLSQRIVDRLHAADLDRTSPMQALQLLQELQAELRDAPA